MVREDFYLPQKDLFRVYGIMVDWTVKPKLCIQMAMFIMEKLSISKNMDREHCILQTIRSL
jgi:hypothetical protein